MFDESVFDIYAKIIICYNLRSVDNCNFLQLEYMKTISACVPHSREYPFSMLVMRCYAQSPLIVILITLVIGLTGLQY